MEKLEGNSDAQKNTELQHKFEKISGKTEIKQDSELTKFRKKFFAEDAKSVLGHVFDSVIVPSLQKLVSDTFKQALDWLIYGNKGSTPSNNRYGNVSYTSYYNQQTPTQSQNNVAPWARENRIPSNGVYNVNNILFDDRADAMIVLSRMEQAIEIYGMVSVGDFYDMIGQSARYTDQKWGWRDINPDNSNVVRNGDKFSIQFPAVIPLE